MDYPDIQLPDTTNGVVTIRKALTPLIKQYLSDDLVTEMAKVSDTSHEKLEKGISKVAIDVAVLAHQVKTLKNTDLSEVLKSLDSVVQKHVETSDTLAKLNNDHHAELTKAFQLIFGQLVKSQPPLTKKDDASDYINVRLTDGQDFYKAIDKYMTAISDGGTIPFQDSTGKAARPLVSNGSLQISQPGGSLVPDVYDYISLSSYDSNGNPGTVVYKSGGESGTTVATLTITYSGTNITSVART